MEEGTDNTETYTTDTQEPLMDEALQLITKDVDLIMTSLQEHATSSMPNFDTLDNCITPEEKAKILLTDCIEGNQKNTSQFINVIEKHKLLQLLKVIKVLSSKENNKATTQDNLEKEEKITSYKDILQECSGTLIDCLVIKEELLKQLQRSSVLDEEMILKVQSRPNRQAKVKVLLKFMMTLGPHALQDFIEALQGTEQEFLANILAAKPFT